MGIPIDPELNPEVTKKTAGIVADDYKLNAFKKALTDAGFTFEVVPFLKNVSTIKVSYQFEQGGELRRLVEKVERSFKK